MSNNNNFKMVKSVDANGYPVFRYEVDESSTTPNIDLDDYTPSPDDDDIDDETSEWIEIITQGSMQDDWDSNVDISYGMF